MIRIEYPPYKHAIKQEGRKEYIFDGLRRKWVLLTPEEWVRQNFISFLQNTMQYPSSLIAVEKQLTLGELKKRFDILVYDRDARPWMIIECKEMDVQLDESVLEQALRYNISFRAPYLVITNGTYCFGFAFDGEKAVPLDALPAWN